MIEIRDNIFKNAHDLFVEEVSLKELAIKYKTPAYIYSENRIRNNYKRLNSAFKNVNPRFELCYAIKANSNLHIMKLLQQEGAGADCSSAHEIEYALKAGFKPDKSLFTAVNPTDEDIEVALKNNFRINLDDHPLLEDVLKIKKPEMISFRINPGIGAGKFDQIIVGGEGAKFGMNEDQVLVAYEKAIRAGIQRFGIHMMTGSCILDADYFQQVSSKLLEIAGHVAQKLKIKFEYVDIGGGLGIPYEAHENKLNLDEVARNVWRVFEEAEKKYPIGTPTLMMEPGRFFVGDAGLLLSKVTHVKKQGLKTFVGVDAGMTTLIRPALYGAYHEIVAIEKPLDANTKPVDVVGPICESTDFFAKDRPLPELERGNLIAILDAGAYGFAMSSSYNGRLKPCEVLINKNSSKLIRRNENIDEIYQAQDFKE